jgi:DNA-binding beta-propeller fold protein YncE
MRLLAAALLVILLSGCITGTRVAPVLQPQKDAATWPSPPETPRLAYAGTLVGERDFVPSSDAGKSTGEIILEVVTGFLFGKPNYIELVRPVSGTVDGKGRILVTDASLAAVVVFDMAGNKVSLWDRASEEENFFSPVGIVEDGRGGFLVTDAEQARVYRLDGQGKPLKGFGGGILTRPTGIARDPNNGHVYVTDTGAHRIVVFDDAGQLLDTIGSRGIEPGFFNFPTHLAYQSGHLYISDTLNFRVQIFDLATDGKVTFGELGIRVGDMTRPKGVAVGADGRVYVIESFFDHLLVYDYAGHFLLPIGGTGGEPGQFYLPAGVWTDAHGRVFVADMFNSRVSIFKELTQEGGGEQ